MPLGNAEATWISRAEADAFMRRYEHLGNVGLGVWHLGLLIDKELASVISFGVPCFCGSRGTLSAIAAKHGIRMLQLCRGGTARGSPPNTASKAIGLGLRAVQQRLGDALMVAYADPRFGEIGTIYQACNAVHTGWTDPKGQADYVIHGRRMNAWLVRKTYGTRSREKLRLIDPDFRVLPLLPKIRYVLIAASPGRRRAIAVDLKALHVPYLKRDQTGIPAMNDLVLSHEPALV